MIDYTKFINSKDIAEHLRKIGYTPSSSVEAAFIVWQSVAPQKEKNAAWNEIIATMQDTAVSARVNTDGVASIHEFLKENMKNRAAMEDLFGALWFQIPTPFKKGDILLYKGKSLVTFKGIPFVLTDMCTWGKAELIANGYTDAEYNLDRADKSVEKHKVHCDFSDMTIRGYFVLDNGDIVHECEHNYLDCEYYRGSLGGYRRITKALSMYLKKEIDVGLLLNAVRCVYSEEQTKNACSNLWQYSQEILSQMGTKKKEI